MLESKHRQQLQRMQDKVDKARQDLVDMAEKMALIEEQKQDDIDQVKQRAAKDMVSPSSLWFIVINIILSILPSPRRARP